MAEYMIHDTTLTAIGDAIREKNGTTAKLTPAQMATAIEGISTGHPNGREWTECTFDVAPSYIQKVVKGGGMYVMGSANSSAPLYYSEDGKSWTRAAALTSENDTTSDIVYANGLWVASMFTGVYYSEDGKSWTVSNLGSGQHYNTEGAVLYANGLWVTAFNEGRNTQNDLYYSEDGKTWTLSNLTNIRYSELTYANGVWVATSGKSVETGAAYSEDGKTWTMSNLTGIALSKAICAETGLWVVCSTAVSGGTGLYYSEDGKTWTQSNVTSGNGYLTMIFTGQSPFAYGGGLWLAGMNGNDMDSASYVNYYSEDGKTWTQIPDLQMLVMVYGNGAWIGCGGDVTYHSEDGKTWTQSDSMGGFPAYAAGIWASGGAYSTDNGKTWQTATTAVSSATTIIHLDNIWFCSSTSGTKLYYSVTWEP